LPDSERPKPAVNRERDVKREEPSVKVEVLYVSECPSHPAAVKLLTEVLAAEGVLAEIHEVLVQDQAMAKKLRFAGSPTIRINGRDVGDEVQTAKNFSLSCRLYPGLKQAGLPPAEMVQRAVVEAGKREQR
jgi:Domain of unknown function (DUF2703)